MSHKINILKTSYKVRGGGGEGGVERERERERERWIPKLIIIVLGEYKFQFQLVICCTILSRIKLLVTSDLNFETNGYSKVTL
jgi:hypothetical protein